MMSEMDWTNAEYLGNIAAEELRGALERTCINVKQVGTTDTGSVMVTFASLRDAETLVSLVTVRDERPGSFYDRVASGCVTLVSLGDDADEKDVEAAMESGWVWMVHPAMVGRACHWHVMVDIPQEDANQITAALNGLHNGGAL